MRHDDKKRRNHRSNERMTTSNDITMTRSHINGDKERDKKNETQQTLLMLNFQDPWSSFSKVLVEEVRSCCIAHLDMLLVQVDMQGLHR